MAVETRADVVRAVELSRLFIEAARDAGVLLVRVGEPELSPGDGTTRA